jgi:hypothetical protein
MALEAVRQEAFALAVPERSTPTREFPLYAPDGVTPIATWQVSSIKLSLRDVTTDAIVNGRSAIEVLNQNGGTLTSGLFVFQFAEDDMPILGTKSAEERILTLDVHLTGGGRSTLERRFWVRNLRDIA